VGEGKRRLAALAESAAAGPSDCGASETPQKPEGLIAAWTVFAPRERPGVTHWQAFKAGWEAATANAAPTPSQAELGDLDPTRWEVDVRVCGERVLTIGSHGYLSGVEDIDRYGDAVRAASEHLRSFIGSGEIPPCFACDGTGQERWMGACGEEVGPCTLCSEVPEDVELPA
jgi:hypothetical protein